VHAADVWQHYPHIRLITSQIASACAQQGLPMAQVEHHDVFCHALHALSIVIQMCWCVVCGQGGRWEHMCKDLTRVKRSSTYNAEGEWLEGGITCTKGLSSRGVPYERTTRGQGRSSTRQDRQRTERLRFDVFRVEHKRTSLSYKGVKYAPYIGSIPKGRSTYGITCGAGVKGTSGGEISAIGWIYIQRVRYGSIGSREWSQG